MAHNDIIIDAIHQMQLHEFRDPWNFLRIAGQIHLLESQFWESLERKSLSYDVQCCVYVVRQALDYAELEILDCGMTIHNNVHFGFGIQSLNRSAALADQTTH